MTATVSAARTPLGAVQLRADPIRDDVLAALGRAALRDPDELLSLLAELGQALIDLDSPDGPRRLPNLTGIRDDLCTHADLGHATVTLDQGTARRLTGEIADAAPAPITKTTGRTAA